MLVKEIDLFIYTFLLLIMYLLSGINKFQNYSGTVNSFKSKTKYLEKLNFDLIYDIMIVIIIALEIIVPVIVLFNIYINNYDYFMFFGVIFLVFFTILATFIYHYPPKGNKYYAFMGNVTATGGLLLLSYIIYNKIPKNIK
tara:strand:- start:1347 stop:1769 length:423 start_codon:yes stop_codon:yes gene_type:complete